MLVLLTHYLNLYIMVGLQPISTSAITFFRVFANKNVEVVGMYALNWKMNSTRYILEMNFSENEHVFIMNDFLSSKFFFKNFIQRITFLQSLLYMEIYMFC